MRSYSLIHLRICEKKHLNIVCCYSKTIVDNKQLNSRRNNRDSITTIQLGRKKHPLEDPNHGVFYSNSFVCKFKKQIEKEMHKSIKWSFGSLFLLVIPVTAFSLGCWQYKRLKWKLGLKESLKEKLKFDVIPFPSSDLSSLKNLEYRKVRLVGEFLHDREFAIKPRGRFDEGYIDHPGGLIANSQSASHGAHIITPFKLADSGIIVLVNRGWVPRDKLNASTRKSGQISGEVTLDAIVRLPEKKGWFDNEPAKNAWYYRDIETMANYHGTAPVFLDAVYGSTVSGGPIGGQTNINIRDDHLSYLITWYLLSALTTIMWLIKFRS